VIVERDLQPLESFVYLASHGINLGDLKGQAISAVGDEVGQGRVCCLAVTAYVLCER